MSNLPLQAFRMVEPANWGFGASATMASQPFVLSHMHVSATASAANSSGEITPTSMTGTNTNGVGWEAGVGNGALVNNTGRCVPWVARSLSGIYPVAVPNAYDRIYIYPMYTIEAAGNTAGAFLSMASTFSAPLLMPFGLLPQTRSESTTSRYNPIDGTRFPDDVINGMSDAATYQSAGAPTHGINTRLDGSWITLPPYSSNFVSANGVVDNAYTTTSPASFARNISNSTFGAGYQLPDDVSISLASATTMSPTVVSHSPSRVIVGAGIEYQTMGAEEIVAVPMRHPSSLTFGLTVPATQFRCHWFLMGVFLG